MVPQGNWMRQLMCDGKVERRWGTYQGTSETGISEAKRGQAKRSQAKRGQAKRSQAKRSQAKRSQAKRSQAKRSQVQRGQLATNINSNRRCYLKMVVFDYLKKRGQWAKGTMGEGDNGRRGQWPKGTTGELLKLL